MVDSINIISDYFNLHSPCRDWDYTPGYYESLKVDAGLDCGVKQVEIIFESHRAWLKEGNLTYRYVPKGYKSSSSYTKRFVSNCLSLNKEELLRFIQDILGTEVDRYLAGGIKSYPATKEFFDRDYSIAWYDFNLDTYFYY